jgi:para-nitrobenzyl esterase
LMSLSEEKIRDAMDEISDDEAFMSDWMFGPVFDGDLLPENPYDYIAEGNTSDIRLMHGSTKDEYHYWLNYHPEEMRDTPREAMLDLYRDAFELSDGKPNNQIDTLYQAFTEYYPNKSKSDKYIDISTWGFFRYPHARLSAAQSQHGPVWEYLFKWSSPINPEKGSCHTIDLPFIFHHEDDDNFGGNPPKALLDQVQNAWISFARNGDPNHSDLPAWPQHNKKDKPKMIFNVNSRVENDPDGVLRDKWNEVMS